jgi:hypothetical protein
VTRLRHEPEAHFGDDAEVTLAEDPIDGGTVGMLEGLPSRVVGALFSWKRAHSCSKEGAVREDDFHTTVVGKVVPIWSVTRSLSKCFQTSV